jgi:hypothetical protein
MGNLRDEFMAFVLFVALFFWDPEEGEEKCED